MLWKDFHRSEFSRVILMQPCWYESVAGGERGTLTFALGSVERRESVNSSAKSDVFIEHNGWFVAVWSS